MKKRFVVIVLDGFGIGAMSDELVRTADINACTLRSILEDYPDLKLPNLEKLGLMNAAGFESANMKYSKTAIFGKSELMHHGADTFMGHQEIMGSKTKEPVIQPFQDVINDVYLHLLALGRKVDIKKNNHLKYLLVDDYATVADNIDADLGMAYNVTAPLDFMSAEELLEIGRDVREVVTVGRVIPFGGTGTTINDILAAEETRKGKYIGIHAVKSKSYNQGYFCRHLGYGVDESVQAPTLLAKKNIKTILIGKVADIVSNNDGESYSCVPTGECFNLTNKALKELDHGFICTNIQETDLAGHSQDAKKYKELLELSDQRIGEILNKLTDEDILVIMADHGNDPKIGHNMHTREYVPVLISKKGYSDINIGIRKTLSDIGQSVCEYFDCEPTQNGFSFLGELK